jgi:pilus assembly protein CpaE
MQQREVPPSAKRAVIISPNPQMAEELDALLRSHLAGAPLSHLRSYPVTRELGSSFARGASHLCFLDVASNPNRAFEVLGELVQSGLPVQIVVLLPSDDPDLILRCVRAGAAEFLLRPFTADQLDAALAKLAKTQTHPDAGGGEPGKIFAVMPAKGACGATTIASNLAFQWKRLSGKKILLADMDPLTGTLSFMLKIKSTYSFLDALLRAHELDKDLWNAMVTPVHGVDVLLAPEMMVEGGQDLRDPSPILEFARRNYDVVMLDTSGVYGEWNLNQARMANEVLLVTTNELPALQAAQRALSYLDTNRIGRWKIRLLVNRYHRDVGLSREVIGTALHTEVFEILPSDYESVQRGLMEGKPIPSASQFGKSILQVADRLGARADAGKKSGGLGGLLGLFSKPSKSS